MKMEEKSFIINKLEYFWYEGEHWAMLLGKNSDENNFKRDIIKAKKYVESLIRKNEKKKDSSEYNDDMMCLPHFYREIIQYLTEKLGYVQCDYDDRVSYQVDENPLRKISVTKSEQIISTTELK